jgi:hypothetical protein
LGKKQLVSIFTVHTPSKESDYTRDFYQIFIMEYEREIAGTMSDKMLARIRAENPHPKSERARDLKEL